MLKANCGADIPTCAKDDTGRFSNPAQTYGLPVVYPKNFGVTEEVGKMAPEAGNLLTAAFPSLTLDEANQILTDTEGPG
ncbi:hypothetical protein EV561_12280, partial [Rhizobium sp. BK376]